MSTEDRNARFEELDAGRAFGDLDASESAEWEALAAELGLSADHQLDWAAAELEAASFGKNPVAMPASLAAKLKASIPAAAPIASPATPPHTQQGKILIGPWLGWALAACLLIFFVVDRLLPGDSVGPQDDSSGLTSIEKAPDLLRLDFSGAGGAYTGPAGQVVWSDSLQQGYMSLENLPANDPSQAQYQLWIVDPKRDEFPVDGGVFDIPAGSGPVTVPIDAKLLVDQPTVFVITLEQPGGVVRSKQEIVVALAQRS